MRWKIGKGVLLLVMALVVTGCGGYHLRGSRSADLGVSRLHIADGGAPLLVTILKTELGYAGIATTATPVGSDAIVSITNERVDERVLSVDPDTGKVREYELAFIVDLSVSDRTGAVLMPTQRVRLDRDYTFDETAVLSKAYEVSILYDELRHDAAQTIIRRLEAIEFKKSSTSSPGQSASGAAGPK